MFKKLVSTALSILKVSTFVVLALILTFGNFQYSGFLKVQKVEAASPVTIILKVASSSPWTVPADWNDNNNTIVVVGAGGGGGAYASTTNLVLKGIGSTTVAFQVGVGTASDGSASWFSSESLVKANGGSQPVVLNGGTGGTVAAGTGFSGGDGGDASGTSLTSGAGGGGSGSASGVGGAGGNSSGTAGHGGAGGGGSGGGSAGSTATGATGANGGTNSGGTGAGTGSGGAGSNGGGGAGGLGIINANGTSGTGGTGSIGSTWSDVGIGGGSGGGGSNSKTGGGTQNGGNAGAVAANSGAGGGGGGAGSDAAGNGANGSDGFIVITYTPADAALVLSGTVYSDEGNTQITSSKTISVAIGTSTPSIYSTTTTSGTGAWSITVPAYSSEYGASTPIAVWVDASTTLRASLFTKASTTNSITGLDLYQDRVIVSHEGTSGTSTTNANMSFYDGDNDTDIQYTSNSGTLAVNKGQELHIKTGKVYAPGGAVTINGNAGSGTDGSFHIPASSTYTAGGLTTIAGNFTASSSATFTTHASGITFSATTTGKTINVPLTTLGDITFDGSGGGWSFTQTTATTTNFTITNGTVVAPTDLFVSDNYANTGTFTHNGGTVHFNGAVASNISGSMSGSTNGFNHLAFSGAGSKYFFSPASTTNFTIVSGTGEVSLPTGTLSIAGNYSNAANNFTPNGVIDFSSTSAQTISPGTPSLGAVTFSGAGSKTFLGDATTTNFTVNSGAFVEISNGPLFISGNYTNSGTLFDDSSNTITFGGTSAQTLSGTMIGTGAFSSNLSFTGAGVKTFSNNASTTNFTVNSGATVVAPTNLSISGNYTNTGTTTFGSGTTTLSGASVQSLSGTMTGTSAFGNLTIANTSGAGSTTQSVIFGTTASTTGTLTMNPSTSAQFLASASTTFQNIALNGAAGQTVYLRSSNQNMKYSFYVPGTQTLTYTDVKDSSACPGSITASLATNIDSGNNSCWDFTVPTSLIISSADNQTFSYAQATTTISTISITDNVSPAITAANDIRIKIATSSVSMLFDTTDTSATFGGTAAGKVSTTVSYEGNGSVLVIAVDTDFDASDTLTISGLSYSQFSALNAHATALSIYSGGASDIVADDADDKTVAITGLLTLANHTSGQVSDNFSGTSGSGIPLYAFRLASTTGENATVSSVAFKLSEISGVISSDLTNLLLYRDSNSSKTFDAGDVAVGGSGVASINGQLGTITFSTSFSATSSKDYILIGDYTAVHAGDRMTVSLPTVNITATGVTTAASLTVNGSSDSVEHKKPGQSSGGGGGEIGGSAPPGAGVETGGGNGGGNNGAGGDTGEQLGNESGFRAPTTTGSPLNQWTNGSNGYSSDGAYTTAATNGFSQSYGTFGFSVPSNNQIKGIEVKFEGSASTAAGTISARLSWDGGSSVTSLKTTGTLTTSDVVYSLGGSSDTWGRTWSVAEFNNGNFTIELVGNTNSNTVQVDAIQVRVYHQATGGTGGGGGGVEVSIPSSRFFASVYSAGDLFWNGLFKHIIQWIWIT